MSARLSVVRRGEAVCVCAATRHKEEGDTEERQTKKETQRNLAADKARRVWGSHSGAGPEQ